MADGKKSLEDVTRCLAQRGAEPGINGGTIDSTRLMVASIPPHFDWTVTLIAIWGVAALIAIVVYMRPDRD
jgi:hypothetical protein